MSRLPILRVFAPQRPLLGKGLLFAKTSDQIIGISSKKAVLIQSDGHIEEIDQPAGFSLSSLLTPDDNLLFILGYQTGKLVGINLHDKKIISETDHAGCSWMGGAGQVQRLAMGCKGGRVLVYQIKEGQPESIWEKSLGHDENAFAPIVALLTKGDHLVVGMKDSIELWSLEQNRMVWKKSVLGNPGGIVISGDDRLIAWFTLDGKASLLDAKTGEVLQDLSQKDAAVSSIGFSPDASRLAMTVMWSPETNRLPSLIEMDLVAGSASLIFEATERMQQLAYKNADEILTLIPNGAINQITRSPLIQVGPSGLPIRQLFSTSDHREKTVVAFRCGPLGYNAQFGMNRKKNTIMANFAQPLGALWSETQCLTGSGHLERYDTSKSLPLPMAGTTGTTAAVLLDSGHYLVGTSHGEIRDINPTDARTAPVIFQNKSNKPVSFLGFFEPNFIVMEESYGQGESGIYTIRGDTLTPILNFAEEGTKGTAFIVGHITQVANSQQHQMALIAISSIMQGTGESRLLVYDPKTNKIVTTVSLQGGVIRNIQWLPDIKQWALAQGNGSISFMEDGTWKITGTISNGIVPVTSLLVLNNRFGPPLLVAGDTSGSLTFWTTASHEMLYSTLPLGKPIAGLSYDAKQDHLILAAGDQLYFWQGLLSMEGLQAKMKASRFDYVEDAISRFSIEKNNKHLDLALTSLNAAIAERPWDIPLRSDLVSLYRNQKEFNLALTEQNTLLKFNTRLFEESDDSKNSAMVLMPNLLTKGIISREWWEQSNQIQHLVHSLQTFLDVLKMDPSELMTHFYLLSGLISSGHFDGIEQAGEKLAILSEQTKHPVKPMAFAKLAMVTSLWTEFEKAIPRELVMKAYDESSQSLSTGNKVMRDLLLHRPVSQAEMDAIDQPREMALVQFWLGLEQQSRKDLKQARFHFQKGMEKEDYFRINQQALARLDGKWQALSVPQEILDQYHTLLGQLISKSDQKQ